MKQDKTVRLNVTIPSKLLKEYKDNCREAGFNVSTRLTMLMKRDKETLKEIQRLEKKISGFKPNSFASGMLLHGLKSELESLKEGKEKESVKEKLIKTIEEA